ncbi:hypothetical protein Pint_17736 [Pistacia integerrima]|uniref:Uncharacterized protein n=1 Tax=Pistacia integerrima TaxID=434235 RepID=A0ACC0YX75_9ROSI|nr:hypothetical protein Pint_17736 [Pistacia integerrima]
MIQTVYYTFGNANKNQNKSLLRTQVKDSNTYTNSKKNKDNTAVLRGPAASQNPLSILFCLSIRSALPFVMPSITECCTTPLPFCHLFSIPVTECCTAPLPFRHLSCADCPLSCCHLSCTVLPAQLVILCYASFAYCRPALHIDDEVRLEDDWVPLDEQLDPMQLEEVLRQKDAHSSAVVLESIGDIPDADIKPPENVLFVCKLNPVTEDEDLHTIFSRFGNVTSAEIIRDYKTGDSLCYAFIEFEEQEACEQAYTKMDNALIDDRRIHVDFSQSVSKLWNQYRRRNNQPGKERGCFKCGALDHIAKDCTGQQAPKYILKEDNRQHGGYSDSRYEMVFDGDTLENPRREKRHRGHDPDDRMEKPKMNRQSYDRTYRDQEKKESRDRHRESDRTRDHREDRNDRDGGCRRDQEHFDKRRSKEMHMERRGERNDQRRDDRDYRKSSDTDRYRDKRDDSHAERRDIGDYRKRNAEIDGRGGRREDVDYRKRSGDGDIGEDRRERQDTWKEQTYRKDDEDEDSYRRRENRRAGAESNDDHDRHRRHGSKDDHRRDRGDRRR